MASTAILSSHRLKSTASIQSTASLCTGKSALYDATGGGGTLDLGARVRLRLHRRDSSLPLQDLVSGTLLRRFLRRSHHPRRSSCPGSSELRQVRQRRANSLPLRRPLLQSSTLKNLSLNISEKPLLFHEFTPEQMSEQFNRSLSLSGKIPSGKFNSSFDLHGCWLKDAAGTKSLCYDGWFIELYRLELERRHIQLLDQVKQDVPSSWDPSSLSRFIEKYGTHIIVGVQIGGSDVIHLKQLRGSTLLSSEVQLLLKAMADERFSQDSEPVRLPVMLKNNIVRIHVIKGGDDEASRGHNDWLLTVSEAPALLSLSLVPVTSLLNGVSGSGFLSHAINLYLRYKPPVKELRQFLEFQLPRKWAPAFNELPLGIQRRRESFPSLKLHWMGPKIYINTMPVESGDHPVTGMRLSLEGKKSDRLAVHLQHLAGFPGFLRLAGDGLVHGDESSDRLVAVKWALLFHVCTDLVQHRPSHLEEMAHVVTKAWLEVKHVGPTRVLFLRLGFSALNSARIRKSQWGPPSDGAAKRANCVSELEELNSGIFAGGPVTLPHSRLSAAVDTSEMLRGPEEPPGYWIVTGAKLCVDRGRISLRVKYSILSPITEEEESDPKGTRREKDSG